MKKQTGFTLIELIAAIALAAIVLGLAVPGMQSLLQRNRLVVSFEDLYSSVALARSESVRRGARVSVCPRNSAGTDCVAGGDWSDGWLIFADGGTRGSVDAGDEMIRVYPPLQSGYGISANSVFAAALSFLPDGRSDAGGAVPAGTFMLCEGGDPTKSRAMNVFITGRVQQAPDVDGDRLPEDGSGTELPGCTLG